MAYSPFTWKDGAAGGTPIVAARLNSMESGISTASATADAALAKANAASATSSVGTFVYSNTSSDFSLTYATLLSKLGSIATLVLNANPGTATFTTGSVIGSIPTAYAPTTKATFIAAVYTGSWAGATCFISVTPAGGISVAYSSLATVPSGALVSGLASWPTA